MNSGFFLGLVDNILFLLFRVHAVLVLAVADVVGLATCVKSLLLTSFDVDISNI